LKNNIILRVGRCYLLLILISTTLTGISQTANILKNKEEILSPVNDEPSFSTKVGAQLPSTGMYQFPPWISHVATVAPNVLCIEIDACKIIPRVQIPYTRVPSDVIIEGGETGLGEKRNMSVVRDGFPLGNLVGKDRKTITLHDRLIGKHLETDVADKTSSYTISSRSDNNYKEALSPVKVSRKTKPTNWTDTSWQTDQEQLGTAKHFIYLELSHSLKEGNTYLINLPELNLDRSAIYYIHDPVYARSEAVHVSQIGFRADDPEKNAFLSIWMGNGGGYSYPEDIEFSLIDDKTNEKVYTGKGILHWKADVPEGIGSEINHSGTDLIRLDFSDFQSPGRYRVSVEGIGCGYPFNIDEENTWKRAFEISMKGHFNHRSGINLLPPFTDFSRPRVFHPADGVKVYQSTTSLLNSGNGLNAMGTDRNNFGNLVAGITDELVMESWGGMMDAGDWDRRINHLFTTRLYLELFELNPEYFKDIVLNIPESGNEIPDIVDEALFGLDIYRRMQTPEGGIRGGAESSEHPIEGSTSWQETQTVLAYAPDHWSSYLYTGVAARAAYVLKMLGKNEEAQIWEQSAVKAMEWAEVEYEKWISAPEYAQVRDRAKNTVPTERNLAAVELYRLTLDDRWHQVYLSTQNQENNRTEASFVYARLNEKLVNKKARENAEKSVIAVAERLVEISANNAYGITAASPGRPIGAYSSAYTIPADPTLVRAHHLSGDSKYLKTILRSTLYVAGANPMNLSLTTGLGEIYVQNPLHEDSRHTGTPAPLGITVFGPFELSQGYARAGSAMETRINSYLTPGVANWPTSESFFDVFWIVPMNEYVIDRPLGQAAYIWGYLASRKNL